MTSAHQLPDDPRIFLKECRTLASAGYDVHLIAPNAPHRVHMGVTTWGVRAPHSGRRLSRMTLTVLGVYRRARMLAADVYHFHDPELIPVGLRLARGGARVIYDVHEDLVASIPDKPWIPRRLRGPTTRIAARLEPAAANRLAGVIPAEPAIAERFGRCRCEVVIVNNYPQLSEFHNVSRPEGDAEPAVCYVGSISAIRGIETLVEALAKTNARLLLAGSMDAVNFAERLHALPGWRQVVNFGQVGRREVADIFSRAHAGVVVLQPVANYIRAHPTKMFEYMAAGLPVIASDFPLWREIIERNACGICVDPLSPDDVADAIEWIVDHPQEARRMGENGRRAAVTTYNWEPEGRKLTSLYERLLGH